MGDGNWCGWDGDTLGPIFWLKRGKGRGSPWDKPNRKRRKGKGKSMGIFLTRPDLTSYHNSSSFSARREKTTQVGLECLAVSEKRA
jgi:hypothetical protein